MLFFVHCHYHLLQAANATSGIKHVYVTLTTLWKFSTTLPEILIEVQRVLDLPELKIVKQSDTRCLAHERYVKAVKASYSAIVKALNNIYEQTHEPGALGISRGLFKPSTVSAMYVVGLCSSTSCQVEQNSPGRENRPDSYPGLCSSTSCQVEQSSPGKENRPDSYPLPLSTHMTLSHYLWQTGYWNWRMQRMR